MRKEPLRPNATAARTQKKVPPTLRAGGGAVVVRIAKRIGLGDPDFAPSQALVILLDRAQPMTIAVKRHLD